MAGQTLILTLVLALGMRLIVSLLDLPNILNFAFFPVLLFGNLIIRRGRSKAESGLDNAVVVVTLAVVASTLANLSNPLTAILLWAALVTPFLLIRLAVSQARTILPSFTLDRLLITFLFIQGAVIGFERFVLGRTGDAAQGFLSGQGAGHHVVGFIGIGTALYLAMRLAEEVETRGQFLMYAGVVVGVAMAYITGTLQSFLAAGAVAVSFLATRKLRWPIGAAASVTGGLVLAILVLWPSFTPSGMNWYGPEYLANKRASVDAIADRYEQQPYQIFFGLGPGESATKVAWTGAGGGNLVSTLRIRPGGVATDLLQVELAKPPYRSSSLTSTWSTWIGVWGDLGFIGLAAYAYAWWVMARSTLGRPPTRRAGLHMVLFLVLIGFFYSWLEEPVLTIFLGLTVAASIARSKRILETTQGNPGAWRERFAVL